MNPRLKSVPNLTDDDRDLLGRVEAAMPITADVSRADLLLIARLSPRTAVVLQHIMPRSISSHYPAATTGRTLGADEEPFLLHALNHGRGGRRQREVATSGAPVLQDVYPILGNQDRVIAVMVVETNLFAYERHRRRDANFRHAVDWLQTMCLRGELPCAGELSRFGLYDGIYLVDRNRTIRYISGIAANLFRTIGLALDMEAQPLAELEPEDDRLFAEVLKTKRCIEARHEAPDGRVWVRKALPLYKSPTWRHLRYHGPGWQWLRIAPRGEVDAVLVLIHNATDAVARQRELNVKSAIIQEIHHRVKNNLQTIAAILRIQSRRVRNNETRRHLGDAVNRILSVAVIHEFLSEDEYQPINIRDLCLRIIAQVQQVAGNPEQEIQISVQGPNIRLPAGQATPVALVLNELVLNALEHGLQGHAKGRITIDLVDMGNQVQMVVCNSGTSLPPDFDPNQAGSLGLQIVRTLVTDDLKGELQISAITPPSQPAALNGGPPVTAAAEPGTDAIAQGTQARVTFPKRSLKVD
jgi:two-component sensor histidine kinase